MGSSLRPPPEAQRHMPVQSWSPLQLPKAEEHRRVPQFNGVHGNLTQHAFSVQQTSPLLPSPNGLA